MTANQLGDDVSVLLGNGNGTFAAPITFVPYTPATWQSGGGRHAIDIDSDGDLDMIGPSRHAPGHLSIYHNPSFPAGSRSGLVFVNVKIPPQEPQRAIVVRGTCSINTYK